MATMEKWINGAEGREVKRVIDKNFQILARHLSSNMLSLTTQERTLLSNDYVREGLRVYDTTLDRWFKYSGNSWVECPAEYIANITLSSWTDNLIYINFNTHHIKNPIVQLYINDGIGYSPVLGGVSIDAEFNITLYTDMPFVGRVVIK